MFPHHESAGALLRSPDAGGSRAAYTQENRPLKVETVLGEDALLLTRLSGEEAISEPFALSLEMLAFDRIVQPSEILGTPVAVSIRRSSDRPRRFHGVVRRFFADPSGTASAVASGGFGSGRSIRCYRAEVVPWFWLLTQARDCRIFQNRTVTDIITEVFRHFGFQDFEINVTGSYAPIEYCVQYRETSFDFVSRLMEEHGLCYFFRHEEDRHVMVIADAGQPWPRFAETTLSCLSTSVEPIVAWSHAYNFAPARWTMRDFNFETPAQDLTTSEPTTLRIPGADRFEEFDYPGRYGVVAAGRQLNRVRAEAREAGFHVVEGASLCPLLVPGERFVLEDHWDEAENGKSYVVARVRHEIAVSDHVSGGGAGTPYRNAFHAFPAEVHYRSPRVTPKPVVQGPQTAIVVGPAGEEIFTDKYGRVKVQFHWDRLGTHDENSSCWVRVSHAWAGAGYGSIQIPRIGQEVIVDFLEGDPDQPIITGRVYNAHQMPPHALPGGAVKSGIKSNSTKGGGGSNELTFDDTKGNEKTYFHAQFNHEAVIENNETRHVKNDHTATVDANETLTVHGDRTRTVDGKESVTVGGERTRSVGGNESYDVGGNRTYKVGGAETITVAGKQAVSVGGAQEIAVAAAARLQTDANREVSAAATYKLQATTVEISATASITLTVGGSSIKIDPSGVTVLGPMIKLN